MRIKEVLLENVTDVVARFYKEAGEDYDRYYNPECVKFKEINSQHYSQFFKEWFENGIVPVFSKPITPPQPEYTNRPKQGKLQSPGYRGLQYSKAAAGIPYDKNVQRYEPSASKMVSSQTMDAVRNNNGN